MAKVKTITGSDSKDLEIKLAKFLENLTEVINVSVCNNTATIIYKDEPKILNEVK